jgi:hypothetical protein
MTQCAAKSKRTGERCQRPVMRGRTVCYHHGGATPRGAALPQTTHGRYSKDLPTRLAAAFDAALSDPSILELNPEIALVGMLSGDLARRLDTRESGAAWRALRDAKRAYLQARRQGDGEAMKHHLEAILDGVDRGVGEAAVRAELAELLERRSRLVSVEIRRLQVAAGTMTAGEAMVLVSALVHSIRSRIDDPDILAAIEGEFVRILGDAGAPALAPGACTEPG